MRREGRARPRGFYFPRKAAGIPLCASCATLYPPPRPSSKASCPSPWVGFPHLSGLVLSSAEQKESFLAHPREVSGEIHSTDRVTMLALPRSYSLGPGSPERAQRPTCSGALIPLASQAWASHPCIHLGTRTFHAMATSGSTLAAR